MDITSEILSVVSKFGGRTLVIIMVLTCWLLWMLPWIKVPMAILPFYTDYLMYITIISISGIVWVVYEVVKNYIHPWVHGKYEKYQQRRSLQKLDIYEKFILSRFLSKSKEKIVDPVYDHIAIKQLTDEKFIRRSINSSHIYINMWAWKLLKEHPTLVKLSNVETRTIIDNVFIPILDRNSQCRLRNIHGLVDIFNSDTIDLLREYNVIK